MLNSHLRGTWEITCTRLPVELSRGSTKKYSNDQIKCNSWLKSSSRKGFCVADPEVDTMSARYLESFTKVLGTEHNSNYLRITMCFKKQCHRSF